VISGRLVNLNVADLLNSVEISRAVRIEPIKLFISYAHKDEELRAELEVHLKLFQRIGLIRPWHDRLILPGEKWKEAIDKNLSEADLILMLISPDFLSSDFAYEREAQVSLERHRQGKAVVVPIIVRPSLWRITPLADLQVLPQDGRPVQEWPSRDSAWSHVAERLEAIIVSLRKSANNQ
jgi:internalin A